MRLSKRTIPLPLILAAAAFATPQPVEARPQYAAREGMYCVSCHVDPAGGGMRTGNGFAYARGRHAWDVEARYEEWKAEPEIAKGVRLGGDIRYQGMGVRMEDHYDSGAPEDADNPTLGSNYAMQGAAYLALMPVEQVLLYYNQDIGAGSIKERDWWGMIRNLTSLNLYVKAGQIRSPYGIRLEDHTTFVRAALESPPGERGIMDVDPRRTLPGIEAGFIKDGVFAHAAFQDPGSVSSPMFTKFKEKLVSARAGYQKGNTIVGGSFRANGRADQNPDAFNRSSLRYGGFALHGGRGYSVLAEVDSGKDKAGSGSAESTRDVLGGLLAGEIYVSRGVTVRGELSYAHLEDKDSGSMLFVSRRAGAGVEWNPVPFFRLGSEGRFVSNSNPTRNSRDEMWGLGYAVFSF